MLTPYFRQHFSLVVLAAALVFTAACKSTSIASFKTPEAALHEFADTLGAHDLARAERLFGAGGLELLQSGDEVADQEDGQRVQQYIREKLAFEDRGADKKVALLGAEGWPFPIPLVRTQGTWRFDVEAGVEEIASRRIGRNELSTLASLHAYVDAQREYAAVEHDGAPRTFARTIFSSPGKHDGLYWPSAAGEPESPLGPSIAEAVSDGYTRSETGMQPFHGYCFRVLLEQGPSAPGGTKSFVDAHGRMTGGFALVAWPAKYGAAGVMSFIVGTQGIVYERDFGANTDSEVSKITVFEPDLLWSPTGD